MSNETKRDVFDEVVAIYEAYLGDALKQAKDPRPDAGAKRVADKFQTRYSSALPDDLPVIPKAVSDYISKAKKPRQWGLLDVFWHLGDHISAMGFNGLYDWERWMVDNQDAVSRAWLLGVWIVEETGEIVEVRDEAD